MTIREEGAYENFFRLAFSKNAEQSHEPFGYQTRLAIGTEFPSLLNAPTGAGKTAAVLGAWLWRRWFNPETVGRRLIYCLPMRTLVEQTREAAKSAIKKIEAEHSNLKGRFSVHTLYGGEVSDDWDIFPEREQIIIGTQDLLLSRALNRGYAMNRFRWAFHFGLFNNDCLWVFDEVQLFGDGLATTAQLAAFRADKKKIGTFGNSNSLWMSATLDKDWLKTVDFGDKVDELKSLELSAEDRENSELKKRLKAVKVLRRAEGDCRLPNGLARFAMEKHERGTQTLIVVNTVLRAQEVFAELEKLRAEAERQAKKSSEPTLYENQTAKPEIKLLHSRFRPAERKEWKEIFTKKTDENGNDKFINRIIVATQVIEAGVDISSKLLITDIAPFPSLVQRFGRVNRTGEFDSAEIFWIDLPLTKSKEKYAATDLVKLDDKTLAEIVKIVKPYEWENVEKSRAILETIDSASPNDLEEILKNPENREKYTPNHVLRQRDLIDLFDTTADLSGFDLDVSRFVRGGEERDVSFYWRENAETKVNEIKEALKLNEARETKRAKVSQKTLREWNKALSADRSELCSVQLFRAKEFLKNKTAWTFDALRKEFVKVDANNLRTGMIILLDVKEGGYNNKEGWHGKPAKSAKDYLEAVPLDEKPEVKDLSNESFDDDEQTYETKIEKKSGDGKENKFISYTQTLTAHSHEVKQAAVNILDKLGLPELAEFSEQIISAAHHHDLGKAHPVFQATVQKIDKDTPLETVIFGEFLAKATSGGKHRRKKFRHELASALALLEAGKSDLEIYLAAAHHGKVRLSIRALPDETKPFELDENKNYKPLDKKFARGIWEDDELPETDLGDDVIFPKTDLNLDALSLGKSASGESSWLERMINLRDELGVFRLAYLEAIVRAADVQASQKPIKTLPETEVNNDK